MLADIRFLEKPWKQDFERGEALRILFRATHIYGVPPKIGNKLGVGGSGGALFIAIFDQLRLQSLPLMKLQHGKGN